MVRCCNNCNTDPFRRYDHPSGVDGRSSRAQTCPMYLPVSMLARSLSLSLSLSLSHLLPLFLPLLSPRTSLPLSLSRSTAKRTAAKRCIPRFSTPGSRLTLLSRLISNVVGKRDVDSMERRTLRE